MHNSPGRHAQSQAECVHNSAGTHAQRPAVSMHFPGGVRSCSPRSQKTRISKGFCEDNLPSVNGRTEQSWEGRDRHCFQFRYMPLPCRQTSLCCLPKSMVVAVPTHPRQSQNQTHNSNKKRMLLIQAASSNQLFGSVLIHFQQDLE